MLRRLQNTTGVHGNTLKWFSSYLAVRKQSLTVNGAASGPTALAFGVPQGSVLGPLLFTCYTSPLGSILERYGLRKHFCADDSQLYLCFKPPIDAEQAISYVEACIVDIITWM